jgi:predicted MFS family arabinose efflux permease
MLLRSSRILRNFGNKKMIIVFLIINMASLLAMVLSSNSIIITSAFILFNGTNTLSLFCIDIFIEHYGDPKTIGKTRGTYLTIENIAWMLAHLSLSF